MMTINRLKALSDSYGADLLRWPADERRDAEALLRVSADAQAILASAAETDALFDAMSRAEHAALWTEAEEAAAVARLRAGVSGHIARDGVARGQRRRWPGLVSLNHGFAVVQANLGWLGLATSGGIAVAGGFLIGAISAPSGISEGVLSLLQTSPLHVLPF
ncbi:hypothetical protein ACELLULO517_16770 [Acidisoma cellulosilytica]|uniref:Uncharacterized protein n=1 Tax=Acidisoma cellulosilyticum TaxID=2802395 RepID=A0A963Z355_9PROT|nr:hypothetical protein [Acidisoma cellulosilyticum]MCB8881899.1 hypothetical protein [Acidisoma cellulosilyticum]